MSSSDGDLPAPGSKREIRARMRAFREAIDPDTRARLSARAAAKLIASFEVQVSQTIALYSAIRGEADPIGLESLIPSGRIILYPRVEGPSVVFCRAFSDELVPGPFGLREPAPSVPPGFLGAIDLVVVPGLAFSRDGHRLGYGRGFYDRALMDIRRQTPDARFIGFGFSGQLVDTLPGLEHDQKLDAVVTEDGLLRFDL